MEYVWPAVQLAGAAVWLNLGLYLGRYCYKHRRDPETKDMGAGLAFIVFALFSGIPATYLFDENAEESYFVAFILLSFVSAIAGYFRQGRRGGKCDAPASGENDQKQLSRHP